MDTLQSGSELVQSDTNLPLHVLKEWSDNSSFQIDALGLVTLLGAEEVNLSVGNLQKRQYTDALPLLASFVLAGDRFISEQPGFVLYNFSDGIITTEFKGWFTRWLMSQKVTNATTRFEWVARAQEDKPRGFKSITTKLAPFVAPFISFGAVTPLLACTILMGDWYGVGNTFAIILSIVTRLFLVSQRRQARDEAAAKKTGPVVAGKAIDLTEPVELCVVRADGKMITISAPRSVLSTFTMSGDVTRPKIYSSMKKIAWVALGTHLLILGMCTLFTQIYTVVLLVFSTWAMSTNAKRDFGVGPTTIDEPTLGDFNEEKCTISFSKQWDVRKIDFTPKPGKAKQDRRMYAWARLGLTEAQEKMMARWNLFPDKANEQWSEDYNVLKAKFENPQPATDTTEKRPVTPPPIRSNARPGYLSTPSTAPLTQATPASSVSGTTPDISRSTTPSPPGAAGVTPQQPSTNL